MWDIVLDGEPTLKDRVLAFFKLAPKKYSFAPEMDAAAKEWIREYKKVFDQLKNNSLLEPNNNTFDSYDAENADSDGVTSVNQQNMQVSGRSAVATTEKSRITAEMSDSERYDILKKRSINNIPLVNELSDSVIKRVPDISSWEDINKRLGKEKRNIIQKIAKEFGVLNQEYFNDDIELSFEFSGNNFRESYNKQGHNYIEFAKMFSVFEPVIESAVGVEIHKRDDYKPDPTLENVFVIMSAYQDGEYIVPVKLEVKQFKDKQNTLYVAISLEKIKKTEVWKQGNTENGVTQNSRSVNISISDLFAKINPSDKVS